MILLTDGLDTASRTSRQAAAARVAAGAFPLYAIGLGSGIDRQTLDALTGASAGGATYVAPTSQDLAGIYSGLSEQILTEYSVEYRSSATDLPDGTTVPFEVSLSRGGTVIARASGSFAIPAGHGAQRPVVVTTAPVAVAITAPPVAQDRPQNTWFVGLLGAMTALMFVLWLNELTLYVGRSPRRRLRALMSSSGVESDPPARTPLLARFGGPLRSIGRALLRALPSAYLDATRHRLELAGEPLSEAEFVGIQGASTALLCFALTIVALVIYRIPLAGLVGAAVGAAAGFALPGLVIGSLARKRKHAIQKALIPSLDMLALSAEAGLAFDGAITQVVQRWKNPLSDELRRLLLEFQMGRDRKQALRELARRTNVPDIGKFVNAVIQADSLGVGIAKVLHDQAIELRTKRRQRAEEQARLAPVKMMFPMVLLIFPALFVVILGPAVPKLTAIFNIAH